MGNDEFPNGITIMIDHDNQSHESLLIRETHQYAFGRTDPKECNNMFV